MLHENKEIILSKNKNVVLPLIIFSNLFPLYGVINYNWTIFSVVYIYWLELLIITFFQFLKILIAKGEPKWKPSVKIVLGIQFLIARGGLFIFYLIFIVVFLGLMPSFEDDTNSTSGIISMSNAIYLKGPFFKFTLLSFALFNFVEFFVSFILNDQYKKSKPSDYNNFLDVHILIVHIVVVLGTFLHLGLTKHLHWDYKGAMIAVVSLFVIIKIIADVAKQGKGNINTPLQNENGKYI